MLTAELETRLKTNRVHVDVPDGDTLLLRNVPASDRFFSKDRTNLLIKRPRPGLPFLVFVDEDLRYTGDDPALVRAFASGHVQQGWRAITVSQQGGRDLEGATEAALEVIGFDDRVPRLGFESGSGMSGAAGLVLAAFGKEVIAAGDRCLHAGSVRSQGEVTVGREEDVEAFVAGLLQWQAQMPVIVSDSGAGKTNLLGAGALKLSETRPGWKMISVNMGEVMAGTFLDSERENLLSALLKEAEGASECVVIMEHLECALMGVPKGSLLLAQAVDRGARLGGTLLSLHRHRVATPPLERRTRIIELSEMGIDRTVEVLGSLRERIAAHHDVSIDDQTLQAAAQIASGLDGRLPAKAIALLDAACARAILAGERDVSLYYLYAAAGPGEENSPCGP